MSYLKPPQSLSRFLGQLLSHFCPNVRSNVGAFSWPPFSADLIFIFACCISHLTGGMANAQQDPQVIRQPLPDQVRQELALPLPESAIWQITDPKITAKGVFKLAWAPNGKWLAMQNRENVLSVFNVLTKQPQFSALAHDVNWIETIQFSSDSRSVVTAAGSGEIVKVLDVATGKLQQEIDTTGFAAYFSQSPQELIVLGKENVERFHLLDGKLLSSSRWRFDEEGAVGISPDGNVVVTYRAVGRQNYQVEILNLKTQKRIPLVGGSGIPSVVALGAGNDLVALGYPDESRIFLWELQSESGSAIRYLLREHDQPIQSITISPDGRWLASADSAGVILIWDLLLRQTILRLVDDSLVCRDLVFAPNGEMLASCSAGKVNRFVTLWDLQQGLYRQYSERPTFDKIWNDLGAGVVAPSLSSTTEMIQNFPAILEDLRTHLDQNLPQSYSGDVNSLLTQLNDSNFEIREQATNELAIRYGESQLELEELMLKEISPETKYRINKVLTGTKQTPKMGVRDSRRWQRIVFACEKVNSVESVQLLSMIADRHQHPRVRAEARQAMSRLQ